MSKAKNNQMEKIVSLAKRRGFVFPSSEIYGGLANVYDYGPLGVELLNNIRKLWWQTFIHQRADVVGIESQILMHPKVWEASGHVAGFHDPQIDCKNCRHRFRADHLVADKVKGIKTDDYDNAGLETLIKDKKIKCPNCGKQDWTKVREFNLMFTTQLGFLAGEQETVYLRPETAQGMYTLFKNVLDSTRQKVPFGIAQTGKAFRNEVTKGKFIFRTLEFEQMELQYFIQEKDWKKSFKNWQEQIEHWYTKILGISKNKFKWVPHHPDKLAHYAKKAEDYEYEFSTGFDEVSGLHYRTDFDLKTHQEHSGQKLEVRDEKTKESFIPHVVESTYGLNRNLLMLLDHAYTQEKDRVVLKLPSRLAPYKVAVFPLLANKPKLVKKACQIYDELKTKFVTTWDARGNIGKRYYYQDEIGTPFCVTVDFESLDDKKVTVRDRDTMEQERVSIAELQSYFEEKLS
jgi:glycyl-tRNA synthetase